MGVIRVIVGEDNPIFLGGLERVIGNHPSTELLGVASTRDTLLALAARENVDVVVTDLRMPPAYRDEGLQVAQRLGARRHRVGVIILSQFAEPAVALSLLRDNARFRGYMLKDRIADPVDLIRAIERVAVGGTAIDRDLVQALMSTGRDEDDPLARLTPREREVLALVAEGLTNESIAERLGLGTSAVEKRIGSVFRKLPLGPGDVVHRRVAATLLYLERTSLGA